MESSWQYSTVHNSACKIIQAQTFWCERTWRVWPPIRMKRRSLWTRLQALRFPWRRCDLEARLSPAISTPWPVVFSRSCWKLSRASGLSLPRNCAVSAERSRKRWNRNSSSFFRKILRGKTHSLPLGANSLMRVTQLRGGDSAHAFFLALQEGEPQTSDEIQSGQAKWDRLPACQTRRLPRWLSHISTK